MHYMKQLNIGCQCHMQMNDSVEETMKQFGFYNDIEDAAKKTIVVSTEYDLNLDYYVDKMIGTRCLKPNAVPKYFMVNGQKFKTVDELLVWIDLNATENTNIMLDMRDDIVTEIERKLKKSYGI